MTSSQNQSPQKNFRTLGKELTIDFGKELGKGKYGKVYHAFPLQQYEKGKRFACKMIEFPAGNESSDEASNQQRIKYLGEQFLLEVTALTTIKSKNVISLFKPYKVNKTKYYLITELCNGGDLQRLLNLRARLDEEDAKIIMAQIVQGMKDMNDVCFMHRDLKLANILLHFPHHNLLELDKNERDEFLLTFPIKDTPFLVKISDLGFAKKFSNITDSMKLTICGTTAYMPPDQIVNNSQHYTEKFDVWSLGVIFYELMVGKLSFSARDLYSFKKTLEKGLYDFPDNINISPEAILLISNCLQSEESKRVSIEDLYNDPYLTPLIEKFKYDNFLEMFKNLSNSSTSETLKQSEEFKQNIINLPTLRRRKIQLSTQKQYTLDEIKDKLYVKEEILKKVSSGTFENLRRSQTYQRNTQIFDKEMKKHESKELDKQFEFLQPDHDLTMRESPIGKSTQKKQKTSFLSKLKRLNTKNKKSEFQSASFNDNEHCNRFTAIIFDDDLDKYPDQIVEKIRDYEVIVSKLKKDDYFSQSMFKPHESFSQGKALGQQSLHQQYF